MHNQWPARPLYLDLLLIYRTLLFVLALGLAACDSTPAPQVLSGQSMGTTYSVALYESGDELQLEALQMEIASILGSVDAIASTYRADSELSRFNSNATTAWQDVSKDFCSMVQRSLEISVVTSGAFDITVGPLVDLWGFGSAIRKDETPSETDVASARRLVGHQNLEADCNRPAIRKQIENARLDLSAWAKGHAADQIAEYLNSVGLSDFLVEVGGELQMSGSRTGKDPFRVALEHAASDDGLTYEVFSFTDVGVATSGDYHNYYEVDGQRFSHTIDPRTGRPVNHTLSTVSVVSNSAADADAYATALLVMGPEQGYAFAVENNIAAYMTEYAGDGVETRETPAFSRLVRSSR